jgi:hypothetical protein
MSIPTRPGQGENDMNINDQWQKDELPIINGIIYENGVIEQINISFNNNMRIIEYGNKLHINNLIVNRELEFTRVIILDHLEISNEKFHVYSGAGGFGGDGFIVVMSSENSLIKWIAFFENSNPFEKIEFDRGIIYGYTNLNEKWAFDIFNPCMVSIVNTNLLNSI